MSYPDFLGLTLNDNNSRICYRFKSQSFPDI